jgi:hypothetical protein
MKYTGVKKNKYGLYDALLGSRIIGSFKTELEAAKAYNEHAKKIFSFPVLNKLNDEEDSNTENEEDKTII